MEVEKFEDEEGNTIQFRYYKGHVFHVDFNRDIQERVEVKFKKFKVQKDDVLICSYPKTGEMCSQYMKKLLNEKKK